jgi:futalosine hydrolase
MDRITPPDRNPPHPHPEVGATRAAAAREGVVVLICSVELEAAPMRARLSRVVQERAGGKPAWRGDLDGVPCLVVAGGMGKTNAAHALTAALEGGSAMGVVGFGVGGAYPGSNLAVGDTALAAAEIYGDEGVETPSGWISTEGIGIPLLEQGDTRIFNHFPLSVATVAEAASRLAESGVRVTTGPFLTVSACSGTARRGAELAGRFGAVCETMEGAAYAHIAAIYGLPFLEVRGISNLVEDRDLSRWRLGEAAEAAAAACAVAATSIAAAVRADVDQG